MQDLASLLETSHEARNAAFTLIPDFQKHFKSAIKYGKYNNVDEFWDDFRKSTPRAYAAAGIAALFCEQDKNEKAPLLFQGYSEDGTPLFYKPGVSKPDKRNKWLDEAFNAHDPLAVAFVFHNKLFTSSEGNPDSNLLGIIAEIYKKRGANKDFLLDTEVLNFLEKELAARSEKQHVQNTIKILKTFMSHTIGTNLMLFEAYRDGINTNSHRSTQAIAPDMNKAEKYLKQAIGIANGLPYDLRGKAHSEMGLWYLIRHSESKGLEAGNQVNEQLLRSIFGHWRQAINAWAKAEGDDRQKAVARFKSFIYDSTLFSIARFKSFIFGSTPFSMYEFNDGMLRLPFPIDGNFLSTTKKEHTAGSEYLSMPIKFLTGLYTKDRQSNPQLHPFHRDVNMLLATARKIWEPIAHHLGLNIPFYSPKEDWPQVKAASNFFRLAITESLIMREPEVREKITNQLNSIAQSTAVPSEKIKAYELIVGQLGLNPAK